MDIGNRKALFGIANGQFWLTGSRVMALDYHKNYVSGQYLKLGMKYCPFFHQQELWPLMSKFHMRKF